MSQVIIAFYIVRMATPAPVQWVVLLVAAVAGTFALYEIVRWVGPLRFLLGMRPRPRGQNGSASGGRRDTVGTRTRNLEGSPDA